jgi:hypothetical protein
MQSAPYAGHPARPADLPPTEKRIPRLRGLNEDVKERSSRFASSGRPRRVWGLNPTESRCFHQRGPCRDGHDCREKSKKKMAAQRAESASASPIAVRAPFLPSCSSSSRAIRSTRRYSASCGRPGRNIGISRAKCFACDSHPHTGPCRSRFRVMRGAVRAKAILWP